MTRPEAVTGPALQPARGRVLISTLSGGGGVETMLSFVVGCLEGAGYEVVIANYQPYRMDPLLSVPLFDLFRKRVGVRTWTDGDGRTRHSIGAWLPELEFTHYWATSTWRKLIESCDLCIAVSGNALAATAFLQARVPFVCWVATGWEADRRDRVGRFSSARRLLDSLVNAPVLRRLEKQILASGRILALSRYTAASLEGLAGGSRVVDAVMPMPIDTDLFRPDPTRVVPWRIGFSGRFTDPRKNTPLLIETLAALMARGLPASLTLIGDLPDPSLQRTIESARASGAEILVWPKLSRSQLAAELQTLDVFVVSSHQEGLCIAALEAMACGCPVVSTRCGGPEEFVLDGETGYLSQADADSLAAAIASTAHDRATRARLGSAARRQVVAKYARPAAQEIFWQQFDATFMARPPQCSVPS